MRTNFKIILVTVVCTTIGWALIIAGFLYFWPSKESSVVIMEYPRPGQPDSLRWQSEKGDYIIRLISSNQATAATSTLFSRTSRAPDRLWFQTLVVPSQKSK